MIGMPTLSVAELVEATGGVLLRGDAGASLRSFDIDTRRLRSGSAFFALKGQQTDGHQFLGDAAAREATAAVVEREPGPEDPAPVALIRVDNTVKALRRCGEWVRKRLSGMSRIAITGSNGKTTTKELLAAGLSGKLRVHRTPGNFNNHLGVPLTLLACPDDAEVAVLELAMSSAGEIAMLTRMTDPDVGVVTNVRAAHLAFFKSLDDIAAAKGELFALLREDAVSVVNLDDTHVRVQAARHAGRRITFGQNPQADLRLEELQNRFLPGTAFTFSYKNQRRRAQLLMGGGHAAANALAALAAVVAVGGELDSAVEQIEQVEPGPGRGQVHRLDRGMILVDDSYNSSPAALASILETLRLSDPRGRRVMVMGDMLELGPMQDAMHREAGKRIAAAGVQLLVAVGPLSRNCVETARRGGVGEVHHHPDSARAAASVGEFLREGDLIVVKGSRSMRMERVVEALIPRREAVN
jgi:UDP-N-acetylmuramoyl-tripeptide--D-alanyl-D-alanine ligase